jgi:hypothetical protein
MTPEFHILELISSFMRDLSDIRDILDRTMYTFFLGQFRLVRAADLLASGMP